MLTFPDWSLSMESLTAPSFSRSWRYVQNWVCFLAATPYSSQAMAYVLSTADEGTESLLFIALATASSTSMRFTSRDLSFESEMEL